MAYGHNYDDEDDVPQRGRTHRVDSAHSSSSKHFDKSSDFSTALISTDGNFLGMKLSPELAERANNFFPAILSWLSDKGEKIGIPLAEKLAKNLGAEEAAARHFGTKAGNAIAYSIIFSNQILRLGRNVYDSAQSLNDLRIAVQPLAKSEQAHTLAPLSGNNEVIANAKAKVSSIFWQDFKETIVSSIQAAPAIMFRLQDQKLKNHEREIIREIEAAKDDPKKLAEVLKKEITTGSKTLGSVSVKNLRAAKEIMIEEERKAYEEKFKIFKDQNGSTIRKEINLVLSEIDETNYRYKMADLKRLGVNTDALNSEIDSALRYGRNYNEKGEESAKNKVKEAVRSFQNHFTESGKGKRLFEDAMKSRFIRHEGIAFDGDWALHSEDRNMPTVKKEIEQRIAKMEEDQRKIEQEKKAETHGKGDKSSQEAVKAFAGLAAGVVGEMFTKAVGGKAREQHAQPIVLDYILHLRRTLEKNKDNPPEEVPGIAINNKSHDKDQGYVLYLHKNIFQKHQENCNRPEIGDRFVEHFDKVHWDDAAIQDLPDDQLTAYEYALKKIASDIKKGRLDAISLIELAGNKQTKIVRDDGRSFGPAGVGKDDANAKVAIATLLNEKVAALHGGQEQTDDQINDKLGNFVFSIEDLKKALDSQELDSKERAFIFTVFSDVVGSDEKLCSKLGVSQERCQELRKESTAHFGEMLDAAVAVLADMIENQPKTIEQHLHLTDKQKELVLSLAESAEEGKNVTDAAKTKEQLMSLETVVANAAVELGKQPALKDEEGKAQGFWQRLVEATKRPKKQATELAANDDGESPRKAHSKPARGHKADHDMESEEYAHSGASSESFEADDDQSKTKWRKDHAEKGKSPHFASREHKSRNNVEAAHLRNKHDSFPDAQL